MNVGTSLKRFSLDPGILAATATSACLIAQQVAGKAVRDALFLGHFKPVHLPYAMAASAVLSLVAVLTMPLLTLRISPRRLCPILFGASGAAFVLEWLLLSAYIPIGAVAVYLHTSVIGPLVITAFWSLINERFDPHSAKRAIAPITGGGTVGGVLGGIAVWRMSFLAPPPSAVLMLAGINIMCALFVFAIPRADAAPASDAFRSDQEEQASAFRLLRTVPFLRNLALLVGVGAILSSLLDYVLGAQVVAHYGKGPELLRYFSLFGLVVSIFSLVLQLSVGKVAVEKIALAVHLAVLPGVVVLGGALGIAVPGLLSASVLRGSEMVHRNTLFRSAYELLYTPVAEAQKRATKVVIDVGFDRAGTFIGSLLAMAAIAIFARNQSVVLGMVVVLAVTTLPVVVQLHRGYVSALKERLFEGAGHNEGELAPASIEPNEAREQVIDHVEELRGHSDAKPIGAVLAAPQETLALGQDLLSHDETRVRAALARLDAEHRIVAGHAMALLADETFHKEARVALRKVASHVTGQLVDMMVDPWIDFLVRRRIPPILSAAPSQRAVDGLELALFDPRFEVRYAAGRVLLRMTEHEGLTVSKERITAALVAETDREEEVVDKADDDPLEEAPLDIVIRDRISRGLEHVFTLLAMLIDREALRLCFRALHQPDARYRGTALEYLQTVLPADVRDKVWPLIDKSSGALPTPRSAELVLSDLTKAIHLTSK